MKRLVGLGIGYNDEEYRVGTFKEMGWCALLPEELIERALELQPKWDQLQEELATYERTNDPERRPPK